MSGRRLARGGAGLSPATLAVVAATGLALGLRLWLLSNTRFLAGITEYDDGVYLGGAVELISGALPYRDFAFVQPPGILLLMAPAALIAKVAAASSAMAAARLATVAASAACVALAGALVRHRGPLTALVACGILALYPDDIMAAHTLLLEPWMNLLVLSGTALAFRQGQVAGPRRLLSAGALLGLAVTVKYWAALPAAGLLAACLIAERAGAPSAAGGRDGAGRRRSGGRAGRLTLGVAAGFTLPALPFIAGAPAAFVRATVLDQAARAGSAVPEPLRLAHLTGLAAALNRAGHLTLAAGPGTLFARGEVTAAATWATTWLPAVLALAIAALLGAGYAACLRLGRAPDAAPAGRDDTPGGPGALGWYALGTLGATVTAVLAYSAFFYHYADFAAPWLAIAGGYAASGLAGLVARRRGGSGVSRAGTAPRGWARGARGRPGLSGVREAPGAAGASGELGGFSAEAGGAGGPGEAGGPGGAGGPGRRGRPGLRGRSGGRGGPGRRGGPGGRGRPGLRAGPGGRGGQRGLALAGAGLVVVAAVLAWEMSGLQAADVGPDAALIPAGACVVTDEVSLAIAADRFPGGRGGCPEVLDALAETLVATNGVSVQGGAGALPRAAARWRAIFSGAEYVWLSPTSSRRIPWTGSLRGWFAREFRVVALPAGVKGEGRVYVRRGYGG